MSRFLLSEKHVHPAIVDRIGGTYQDTVQEVITAISEHDVVVVGMAQNPFVKKARRLLDEKGISYHYLEYGSYFSEWQKRLAIKMYTGWPTYPQVFSKGTLIGGFKETEALINQGELS